MATFKQSARLIACGLLIATGSVACGGSVDESEPSAAPVTSEPDTKPDRLVIRIWSGDQETLYAETAAKKFTEDTGIPIVWDTTDEAVSYAKINQEIAAGDRPSVDASFNAQQRAFKDAARGWTIPLSPTVVPILNDLEQETAKPAGTDVEWPYVIPYTLSVPIIVRTDKVDPATLKTWDDLFSPDLEKSVVLDSLYSSTAFGFAESMGIDPATDPPEGMQPVWDKIAGLKPNLAQLGSNSDVVTALTDGSVSVAISNTGSGIAAQNAGAPIAMIAPDKGLYVVGDAYYIHKGIPDENAYYAQVFANYFLDPEVQTEVAEKIGFVPVHPAATVPEYMSENPRVFPRTVEDLTNVGAVLAPIPLMARYDSDWQKAFDSAILN